MSWELEVRVTMMAVAEDSSSEGIWATRPSPMLSRMKVLVASAKVMPAWVTPMTMPPMMLMNRIRIPAMASPRTNLLAPSMEP